MTAKWRNCEAQLLRSFTSLPLVFRTMLSRSCAFLFILGGVKKTIVDQHTLAARANRGDRPMPRAGDITIPQLKQPARLR